jgi:hypothetical protein
VITNILFVKLYIMEGGIMTQELLLKSVGSIPLCLVNNHKGVTKPSNTTIDVINIV